MTALPPLLFLELLATPKLQPGALLLQWAGPVAGLRAELDALPEWPSLAADFPCFTAGAAEVDAVAASLLHEAGLKRLAPAALQRASGREKPVLAAPATWLAGDWYQALPLKPNGNQSASRALALKLLQLVAADADTRQIEDIFRQDPTLSYHLLRLVNSLGGGSGKKITSFAQAILILGRQQLRRWLNLMLFAARQDDHRSAMLLAQVAIRAQSMELAARFCGFDKATQDLAFMTGMFSMLGILFGLPASDVLKPLQLSDRLVDAVLHRGGEIGRLLLLVETGERGDAPVLAGLLGELQLSARHYNQLQLLAWRSMLDMTCREQVGVGDA